MAEFKAQILGILLVLGVFGVLLGLYESFAKDSMDSVSTKVSEVLSSIN